MSVIQSLVGGVIGAAIATAAYLAIRPGNGDPILWYPLVTGVLTGLLAGVFGGKERGSGSRVISGGLAALIAGAAIFGADWSPSLKTQAGNLGPISPNEITAKPDAAAMAQLAAENETDSKTVVDASASPDSAYAAADQNDAANTPADSGASPDAVAEQRGSGTDNNPQRESAQSSNQSAGDMAGIGEELNNQSMLTFLLPFIFPGLGILLAYQLARGFRDAPTYTDP